MVDSHARWIAGRYRVIEVLGSGGMGRVSRCHDEVIGRDVAVKEILLPQDLDDERRDALAQRAIREARAAGRLNHPGIITVHDVVEHEGSPAIVMEFVEGGSLADLVAAQGALPPERAAAIGTEMLAALRVAHAAGIVHRDLKPANVLLADDRVVITDFGIASLAGDTQLTRTGMILGTPAYMSPEQAAGEAATAASDMWSLGATLYTAVEGRPPFEGENVMAVLAALVTRDPVPPTRAGPLAPLLTALLRKDPAARPTAEQAARLRPEPGATTTAPSAPAVSSPSAPPVSAPAESAPARPGTPHYPGSASYPGSPAYPGSAPPGPPPPGPPPYAGPPPYGDSGPYAGSPPPPQMGAASYQADTRPGGRAATRRRSLLLAGGATALLAIGVPSAIWVFGGDDSANPDRPGVTTSGGRAGSGANPAASGQSGSGEQGKPVEITDAIRISGIPGQIATVAFSPDGTLLAGGDNALDQHGARTRLWDPATGRLLATLVSPPSTGGNSAGAVAFSPNGKFLATGGNALDESTWLWRVADRRRIGPLTQSRSIMKSLAFSPDSQTVAGVTHTGAVTVWDVASRRVKVGLPDGDGFRNVAFSRDGKVLANPGKGTELRLSDPAGGRTIRTIDDATGNEVAFSPDGGTIAVPDSDGTHSLRLWNVASGTSVAFDRTDELVASLAFSPDGKTIATWNSGNVIQLWDVSGRRVRALLIGHSAEVISVAFDHGGSRIASSSRDQSIRIWKAK